MTPFTHEFPWPAPAKLNLFLHITGRRADGYHLLQTVFQLLDYGDDLFFTPRGDGVIRRTDGPAQIAEHEDLVVRAAQALQQATGAGLGADIRVHKRIPLGGGLGGGSSDAATTLVALNLLWNTGLTVDELARLGLELGADVPVFVRGHSAWAEGVGEHLRPIELGESWYLVVTPPVAVSTAEIFAAPELKRDCTPLTPAQVVSLLSPPAGEGCEGMDARGRAMQGAVAEDGGTGQTPPPQPSPAARGRELVCNVCEPVTFARYPQVRKVFDALSVHGTARMSGTGASCFVVFASREAARQAQETLPKHWKHFIAQGRNYSPLTDVGLLASLK